MGAQLRTWPDDGGATLGYTDRIYVLPRSARIAAGRYWLDAPLSGKGEFLSVVGFSVGLDVLAQSPSFDVSLGVAQHVLLARVAAGKDVARAIYVDVFNPERTVVRELEGCPPC